MDCLDHSYVSLHINEKKDKEGQEHTEDDLREMIIEGAAVFPKPFILSQFSEDQVVIRLSTTNKEGFLLWLKQYQKLSYTTFRVQTTKPRGNVRVCYKAQFRCQHDTQPHSHRGRTKKPSEKHTNCEVRMSVTIAAENANKTKAEYIRYFPTVVKIRGQHNHGLDIALKFREPDEAVKKKLIDLLQYYGPSKALNLLKQDLMANHGTDNSKASVDRAQCPDLQWVYRFRRSIIKKGWCDPKKLKRDSEDESLEKEFSETENLENEFSEGEILQQESVDCDILEISGDSEVHFEQTSEVHFEQTIQETIDRPFVKCEYEFAPMSTAYEKLEIVCDKFRNLIKSAAENNPEGVISALTQFEKNLMNLKTDDELLHALHTFSSAKKNNYRKKKTK